MTKRGYPRISRWYTSRKAPGEPYRVYRAIERARGDVAYDYLEGRTFERYADAMAFVKQLNGEEGK